jgi:hypothetical protein
MSSVEVRRLLGANAVHVPAWLYVQDAGAGVVSFVGASRISLADVDHPMRYGSRHSHQLIVGELVVRPHQVYATNALEGMGLSGLVSHPVPRESMERVLP